MSLAKELGERDEGYSALSYIAERLAVEAGHPAGVDVRTLYDEADVRVNIKTDLERCKARNQELRKQNADLERARLDMLKRLRVHAVQLNDSSLRFFGLTGEQMMLVNEYAENLRDGRNQLPTPDRYVYRLVQPTRAILTWIIMQRYTGRRATAAQTRARRCPRPNCYISACQSPGPRHTTSGHRPKAGEDIGDCR